MPKLELEWEWELESPLHCGSGLSRPGYADRLIAIDPADSRPVIPGDAVKGALRMSAEQLLAWLGYRHVYASDAPIEPGHALLASLFGGASDGRFHSGRLKGVKDIDWRIGVVSATAIDNETGQALKDTLRTSEVLGSGARFKCACSVTLEEAIAPQAATLLAAALASTESIGGRRAAGWGQVRLGEATIRIGGTISPLRDILTTDRLALLSVPVEVQGGAAPAPADADPLEVPFDTWYRIVLTLDESACLNPSPDVSNQVSTRDVVPATALRGALRSAWLRDGQVQREIDRWLSARSRWSPAFPASEDGAALIPVPASYACEKGNEAMEAGEPHGVHDLLTEQPAPAREGDGAGGTRAIQWRPPICRWMQWHGNAPVGARVETQNAMHVALAYDTGSKRAGALFSREEIQRGNMFVAYALLPAGIAFPEVVHLGKRRSAGHGQARVTAAPIERPQLGGGGGLDTGTCVYVELLTPAHIVDKTTGYPLRSLGAPGDWTSAGLPPGIVSQVRAVTRAAGRGGWMSPWGHGRKPEACVEAGSVWRLDAADADGAAALRAALDGLGGVLGQRGHEGFGWFVMDPPWLGSQVGREAPGTRAPEPPDGEAFLHEPLRWPGCEAVPVAVLEGLVAALPERVPSRARRPLQELARRARDPNAEVDAIMALVHRMTHGEDGERRGRKSPWQELQSGKSARGFLDEAIRPAEGEGADQRLGRLRFAVEALLIRAEGEE